MGAINFPDNVNVAGKLTCDDFDPPADCIDADALSPTMATGQIQLPLINWIDVIAIANDIATEGDATSLIDRVSASDPSLRLIWEQTIRTPICCAVASPPDLDNAEPVVVKVRARVVGTPDTPTLAVDFREDVGGSNLGGNTGALSTTLSTVEREVNVTADTTTLKGWTITLTPGTHNNNAIEVYAIWLEYRRK